MHKSVNLSSFSRATNFDRREIWVTWQSTHICYLSRLQLSRVCSGKESACQCMDARDTGLILGSGRSPGVGNGNPLQSSCLVNSMHRGAWQLQFMGSRRVRHNWASGHQSHRVLISIYLLCFIHCGKHLTYIIKLIKDTPWFRYQNFYFTCKGTNTLGLINFCKVMKVVGLTYKSKW